MLIAFSDYLSFIILVYWGIKEYKWVLKGFYFAFDRR
jgi:hypothetical protein